MPRTPHKFGPARRRFLEHLKETGHLGQSATAAGVHYTTTRRRLRRAGLWQGRPMMTPKKPAETEDDHRSP